MSDEKVQLPKGWVEGLVPTLNHSGFMFEVLDEYADDFILFSGATTDEVLEIGCAYGVATIAALNAGGRVRATDIDQRHLDILRERVPEELQANLTTEVQSLPKLDLPENEFAAILCSRVLHFLSGDDIDASVKAMFKCLQPGGSLYIVADSAYGVWRKFIPVWKANVAAGKRWPGYMEPALDYLPYEVKGEQTGPDFMNLLSPELLERTCTEAGFEVKRTSWISRDDFKKEGSMDGRENCGILAIKPRY